ncbi:metallophosphoesterase [Desulfoplanes sp.]
MYPMDGQNGSVPMVHGKGILFVADPHVADEPPFERQGDYCDQVLAKLRFCLQTAVELDLIAVFLGDMFHWPVDNSEPVLEELHRMFKPHHPWVLVGNHDKHLDSRAITPDVSLVRLEKRKAIRIIQRPGPVFRLQAPGGTVLLGASPDGYPLPSSFSGPKQETVIWIGHHNVAFADFRDKPVPIQEIPGVHWMVNGHIHRPQPSETRGMTRWVNPGNITRLTLTTHTMRRKPTATIWRPGCEDLERVVIPHLPIGTIFPAFSGMKI